MAYEPEKKMAYEMAYKTPLDIILNEILKAVRNKCFSFLPKIHPTHERSRCCIGYILVLYAP